MTDYPQIPSPNYRAGRIKPVRLIVLHTAETPCEPGRAVGIATYLARPSVQASAHYCVDPLTTVQGVQEEDTAWAAPGANADGIQIEQAGYAGFTAADWAGVNPQQMITGQLVPLVAGICTRWGIPPVALDTAGVLSGAVGITTHVCVSEAYGLSDHWDCGPAYPLDAVVAQVAAFLEPSPPVPPEPPTPSITGDDDMALTIIDAVERPTPYQGRTVWDLAISGPAQLGGTAVQSWVAIMPVTPTDTPISVDIHCTGIDGAIVNTLDVKAVTFWPVPFTGRVSVVAHPATPVLVHGREIHYQAKPL
jgi:N-acetylmuramoyl-L-alanine amidase